MGEKTACQCRGHRFNPWFEKSAHGMEQLGPCASTEPIRLRAVLPTTEALAPQLEKASSWQQRPPGSANNKQNTSLSEGLKNIFERIVFINFINYAKIMYQKYLPITRIL